MDTGRAGKVPVWEEAASFRIFESRAILKHVSFGSSIYPADNPRLAGTIEQWVSVEYSYFYPAWMPIFVEKILKPRKDKSYQADMKIVEAKKQELLPTLDLLNTHLADNAFLGGDCFTVADITFMPYIALFGAAGLADVFESRPNLARWKEEILSRDSWKYAAENKARRLASPSLPLVVGAPAGTVPPLTRYIAYCILLTLSGGQVAEKFI